jgi:hypothetical protein
MSVIGVEKDFDSLSVILVAEFDASIERGWQLWADPLFDSTEHMEQMERGGMFEGVPQSVGQMDALLA